MKKSWLLLVLLIVGTEAVGFLSGQLAGDSRGMYANFDKIPLAPPGSVFGIVWPILYLMMAIALYVTITNVVKQSQVQSLVAIYLLQLILNFFWSIVFFRGDLMLLGVVIILALLLAVAYQIKIFYQVTPAAGLLLVPYWLWLVFALYLNIGFALVN